MTTVTTPAPGSLEAECPGGLAWAFYGLGECIRTPRDKVSIAFGVLSIAAWFMFGFPQMITNCIKKIPDEAVSPFLLIFWLIGDSLNFIGAFLTNQLFLQKVLAGYTVVIDLILIAQYVYYLLKHRRLQKKNNADISADFSGSLFGNKKSLYTVFLGVVGLSVYYGNEIMQMNGGLNVPQHIPSSRHLFQEATTTPFLDGFLDTPLKIAGYVIGWVGAAMYFCSRVPQIVKNFKRKSTEGLSVFLFLLAVFGNTFYGLQIFIKSIDAAFVVNSLPWILGSLGILVFDFIILIQFCMYRGNSIDVTLEEFDGFEYESTNAHDGVKL